MKPDAITLCDNGDGMISEMISYAVRWGGTDREDDRRGFGRYGYGLPSAAVSLARRYTVYAKSPNTDWHAVTVDIDELAEVASDLDKTQKLLPAKKEPLPAWIQKAAGGQDTLDVPKFASGVVIVLEELDYLRKRLGWIKVETITTKLLQHFGVIYRHWLQKRVYLNTDHPFYRKLYERATPEAQSALEVLLFVLAERELGSSDDVELFYKS